MATQVQGLPPASRRWLRRALDGLRGLFEPGDVITLLIVIALVLIPVLALSASGWPLMLETIIPALLLSVVLGFMLARSQYNELLALLMSTLYGTAFILLIAALNEPGNLGEGVASVISRSMRWLVDAFTGGINQDALVFTLLIAALVWFLGYSAAWHIFRIDMVWRAVLPPGLILITNHIYYSGEANLDPYLFAFFFMALVLLARSHLDAREWDWYMSGMRPPRGLRSQFLRLGAVLALVALLVAWAIPSNDLQERLDRFQEFMSAEPLMQMVELWNRLFSSMDTQGPTTADYYGGDSLQLGGAIRLGDQQVFSVAAPPGRRYYWRSRVFDTYERGRWLPAATTRLSDPQSPLNIVLDDFAEGSRVPVRQEFTIGMSASRLVYAAPQPIQIELPTRTDLRYVPPDDRVMNISVIRPMRVLNQGDRYAATSLLSTATAAQLRSAPTDYPQWLRDLYLYVSPSVTGRTRDLARAIVEEANAITVYDQARAIETWLRLNMAYNETIPQPPRDRDPVDWFLFDLREGYCNYYASAMIMMLRSLGVPARMAAGFAQGTWDAASQQYIVLERDAHTWVEVYFPGYGWVEFEPTAAQAPINRVDDIQPAQQPTPTPQFSPTPTATATPTATPTMDPTVLPQSEIMPQPTLTSTPSPTPTVTPVIVPTQPNQPPPPQTSGPLAFLLPVLGIILLGLLVLMLLAALVIFVWWWWEWRGMGGLSPVSRAYARLERFVPLIGVIFSQQQTPEERRRSIARDLPPADPAVSAITRMYTAERYGPGVRLPAEADIQAEVADEAWSDARGSILKRFLRRLLPWNRR